MYSPYSLNRITHLTALSNSQAYQRYCTDSYGFEVDFRDLKQTPKFDEDYLQRILANLIR